MKTADSATNVAHFFIAGAQRSGTTYLYGLLDQHPEIQMARPLSPEPKYFLTAASERADLADYLSTCFSPMRRCRVRGEKSTSYLERLDAARRIQTMFSDARFVLVLRDPVERAISNYWFSVQHGVEHLPVEAALSGEEERRQDFDRARFSVSPFSYVRRGRYIEDLAEYQRLFPRSSMKLIAFERLIADPARSLVDLFAFLGVAADFRPQHAPGAVNASERQAESYAKLKRRLAESFVDSNRALAEAFDFDIGMWQIPQRPHDAASGGS